MKAVAYLPWLVLIAILNESTGLFNLGVYRKNHGYLVLTINSLAALVALIGYWIAIPTYGIIGAIGVTIVAQSTRLCLYVVLGQREITIPYALGRFMVMGILTAIILAAAPHASNSLALIAYAIAGLSGLAIAAYLTRLISFDFSIFKIDRHTALEAAQ